MVMVLLNMASSMKRERPQVPAVNITAQKISTRQLVTKPTCVRVGSGRSGAAERGWVRRGRQRGRATPGQQRRRLGATCKAQKEKREKSERDNDDAP